jgi:hypothetical protein
MQIFATALAGLESAENLDPTTARPSHPAERAAIQAISPLTWWI